MTIIIIDEMAASLAGQNLIWEDIRPDFCEGLHIAKATGREPWHIREL
jgi:hypothetical protein